MDLVDHTGRPWKNGRPLDAHGRTQHSNPDRWDRELLRGDMGRIAVPTVLTFSAILGSAWKAYWHGRQDEAYRNSRPDALAMRRDVHLMGLLQERILSVTSLKWHIEGHDEKNPREVALRDLVEKSIRKIPDWRKFLWAQQLAVWYGKYGCQLRPKWREIDGQKALTFDHWAPVNGDKIGHRWDGTPYVLVNAAWADRLPSAETFPTTLGRGLLLEGRWRNRFVVHSHEIEDGDFFDPESAAAVHGLGLRHRIYWYWWVKQEAHEWIFTYLQRVGLGITLWMYDASNPDAKARAEEAAAEADRRTNLLVPTWPDARGGAPVGGVERIETPVTGVEALRTILDKFDEVMERYVVGQSMSGGSDNKDGLGGTGRANFARDTKAAITEHDAYCLGETLTGSEERPGLVWLIQSQSATDPGLRAVPLRLVFDVESPESKERLDAAKVIFDMGVSLLASEVRAAAGFSKPNEDDEVVQKPDENAGQQPIQEQRDDPQLAAQALQQEIEADRQRHDAELAQKQAQHEQALRHEEEKHKHAMEREQTRTRFDAEQAQAKARLAQQQAQQKAQWQQQAWQARQQQQQQAWQQKQQQAAQQPAQPAQQAQGAQAQPTDPYTTSYSREFDESSVRRDEEGRFAERGATNRELPSLKFSDEVVSAHSGQVDTKMIAHDESGRAVAFLDYSIFQGKPHIGMVKAIQPGIRAGERLVDQLADRYGYENIEWGMMTEDGYKLQKRLDDKYGIERVVETIDPATLVSKYNGKILRDDDEGQGFHRLYIEFDTEEGGAEFAEKLKAIGSDDVDLQQDDGRAWVGAVVSTKRSIIRKKVKSHPPSQHSRESLLERLHSLDGSEAGLHALADEILALPDAVAAEAFVRGEAPYRPETEGQQVVRYLREAGEWGLAEVLQYGWVEGKNPPRNRPAGYKHWYGTPPDSGKRTQKTMPHSGGGKKKVDEVVASVRKDLKAGKLSEDTLNDLRSLSGPQLSTLRHYLGLGDRQRKGEKKEEFRERLEGKLKNPPSPIDNEKEQGKIPPESHQEVTEPTGGSKMKIKSGLEVLSGLKPHGKEPGVSWNFARDRINGAFQTDAVLDVLQNDDDLLDQASELSRMEPEQMRAFLDRAEQAGVDPALVDAARGVVDRFHSPGSSEVSPPATPTSEPAVVRTATLDRWYEHPLGDWRNETEAGVYEPVKMGDAIELPEPIRVQHAKGYEKGGGRLAEKSYVARITGRSSRYGFERKFDEGTPDWGDSELYRKSKGTWHTEHLPPPDGGVYELNEHGDREYHVYYPVRENGRAILKLWKTNEATLQTALKELEGSGGSVDDLPAAIAYGAGQEGNTLAKVRAYIKAYAEANP